MSRVPDEPRTWSGKAEAEEVAAELRRQIEAVKAKLEEHRSVMRLAGLTSSAEPDQSEPNV